MSPTAIKSTAAFNKKAALGRLRTPEFRINMLWRRVAEGNRAAYTMSLFRVRSARAAAMEMANTKMLIHKREKVDRMISSKYVP